MNRTGIKHMRMLADERGLSLIEILVAVTIMSIISVSIMGYFVQAADRSADESRRIIAANLARWKAAEIREMAEQADIAPPQTNYGALLAGLPASNERRFTHAAPFPAPYEALLSAQTINGTTYTYEAVIDKSYEPELAARMAGAADEYLLRLRVTVSWHEGIAARSAANSTTVEAYLREPG